MQPDHRKHRDLEAERPAVEIGVITLNEPRLFERPDAAQAGRRRDADTGRQFDIGDAPVGLKLAEDVKIGLVELGPLHGAPPSSGWLVNRGVILTLKAASIQQ